MLGSNLVRCRSQRLLFIGGILFVSVISLGGLDRSALAGEKSDGDEKASAKAHYQTATRHYEIREFDKALLEYKAAYLAQPDTAFLFNIGQCYRKLGQEQEALNFFQLYLKKASGDDPNRRQVEARIRDIQSEAKTKGGAGEVVPSAPPPASTPTPTMASSSETPATSPAVVAVEQTNPAASPASGAGRGLRFTGIACGAVGLASIGAAIYYYSRAKSLSDRVTSSPSPTAADDQAGRDAQTKQWIFYSVGAGALAAGTLLYILGWPSSESPHPLAGIAPIIGPGQAGVSAQGAF